MRPPFILFTTSFEKTRQAQEEIRSCEAQRRLSGLHPAAEGRGTRRFQPSAATVPKPTDHGASDFLWTAGVPPAAASRGFSSAPPLSPSRQTMSEKLRDLRSVYPTNVSRQKGAGSAVGAGLAPARINATEIRGRGGGELQVSSDAAPSRRDAGNKFPGYCPLSLRDGPE